ncbi:MAG: hypothetical protein GY835_18600 [bacterium]|nr:hypothetical protein [bacterium]
MLSPVGSKALALGAMMTAIERDLPILFVEALSYSYEPPLDAGSDAEYTEEDLVHVWLDGEAYPTVHGPDAADSQTVDPAHVRCRRSRTIRNGVGRPRAVTVQNVRHHRCTIDGEVL